MGYGRRDSFAENVGDYLFDDDGSDISMDIFEGPRRRRKAKKRRAVARKSNRSRPRKKRTMGTSSKRRKGMSKEFLRQLRKKHHLGEFKRR